MALLAQATIFRLRQNPLNASENSLRKTFPKILTNLEGNIRVKGNSIIVTDYKDHEKFRLKNKYQNISKQLEKENISPKIPWLYDFKLDFRFK